MHKQYIDMAAINKIKIGEITYDIIPQIGTGLQFGTQIDNCNIVYVNIGEAKSDNNSLQGSGISITPTGFIIDTTKFTAFLKALGFKTE